MRATRFTVLALIAVLLLGSASLLAQNIVSGELTGTVTDPQGAVLANVPVTLTSDQFGTTQTTNTNANGFYRFALLRPGNYKVTVNASGFAPVNRTLSVAVGQVTTMPIQVAVQGTTTTVEVTSEAPLLQTENANVTASYTQKQIELLPSPGQDLTNYALTAPGAVLSTGMGYGNFTAYGLPGTSNLFTINGNDTNDPFNGLNNSGSSNNMLGTNEVQELAIVSNGYTGSYGRAAGVNVNFSTKSGGNSFHGNGIWWWNGRSMNANDFFIKQSGADRPFANSNQWGGSFGGPIKKDKLFFFYDNEGLRYVLPSGTLTYVPSPQFEAASLSISPTASMNTLYNQIFGIYDGARNRNVSTALATNPTVDPTKPDGGCDGVTDMVGVVDPITGNPFGQGVNAEPCLYSFRSNATSKNTERLQALSVDWVASGNDKVKFRWWEDRGTQATYTDPLTPSFNATSPQPQDTGQANWTHVFNTNIINQVIVGGSYYSAIFGGDTASTTTNPASGAAFFPSTWGFLYSSVAPYSLNAFLRRAPQGRNVSQWQVVDDLSWTKGNHNLRFGANIRHNNITDLTPFVRNFGWQRFFDLTSFYQGVDDGNTQLSQRFDDIKEVGFTLYSLGLYAQDEWSVTPKLKITLTGRIDRNSNESCHAAGVGCINMPVGNMAALAGQNATPYNQLVQTGLTQAFPSVEPLVFSPRFGAAYSAFGGKTVFRGGVGMFTDLYPGITAERFAGQLPSAVTFTFFPGGGNTLEPDATVPTSIYAVAAAGNAAFQAGFPAGQNFAAIQAASGGTFTRPLVNTVAGEFRNPKYLKWNFEVQQLLGQKMSLSLNYVGTHGWDEILINNGQNAASAAGLLGLPTSRPNNQFNADAEVTNNGYSNYNGLTATLQRRFTKGFTGNVSYTWSHSLDTVSNGGQLNYSFATAGDSLLSYINPFNLSNNYGNSDYDFRHNLSANWVWELPFKASNGILNQIVGGWSWSGTLYARSGGPYSVIDSGVTFAYGLSNASTLLALASFNGGALGPCNDPGLNPGSPTQCLANDASQFTNVGAANSWGNTARNFFRGPKFVSSDMSIYKTFKLTESGLKLQLGINGYNIFNHPNFLNPDNDIQDAGATFGQILGTAYPASSPYGNFQGAAVGGRLFQTMVKIQF